MSAFVVRETCDGNNYMIGLSMDYFNETTFRAGGSYAILEARLLGLSYGDYLRYCVTKGGTLRGRDGFPHVVFRKKNDAETICKMINKEWENFNKELINK